MHLFNNIKVAFADKSNEDLKRAYLLFKVIRNPLITNILTLLLRLAIKFRLPLKNIIRITIYKQFCGGTTIEDSNATIEKLWRSNIGTILDFSAEGKSSNEDFIRAQDEIIATIYKANKLESIPFAVFKPTGITKSSLLEKISSKIPLNKKERLEKKEFISKMDEICMLAHKKKVPVFIDAEESWIQPAIDDIAQQMMKKYNSKEAYIYNTLQMYRKDRIAYLKEIYADSKNYNYFIGLKIVRGAYHDKEISRAKKLGYTCPVYTCKKYTDKDFNIAQKFCVEHIDKISFCSGTHNEESVLYLIKLIKKNNLELNDKRIISAQLLGMSDHVSYNLSKTGYNVAKYVPYGPIQDVIPYLIRRAKENTSISGQMNRELKNITKEKKRRIYESN